MYFYTFQLSHTAVFREMGKWVVWSALHTETGKPFFMNTAWTVQWSTLQYNTEHLREAERKGIKDTKFNWNSWWRVNYFKILALTKLAPPPPSPRYSGSHFWPLLATFYEREKHLKVLQGLACEFGKRERAVCVCLELRVIVFHTFAHKFMIRKSSHKWALLHSSVNVLLYCIYLWIGNTSLHLSVDKYYIIAFIRGWALLYCIYLWILFYFIYFAVCSLLQFMYIGLHCIMQIVITNNLW